ncbi:MAG TPA: hypothetical protein VJY33_11360 [Isosphaeraceae bacterium]|nr:hypothetical protein [Isosphaeraceae bacterium]
MNTAGLLSLEAQALFGLVSLVLVATAPVRGSAVEPRRPGQESFLTRAVFADERLWVLSDAGELSSIREGRDERVEESLPESALDLCLRDGHPMVITCQRDGCTNWTLRRWVSGKWSVDATVPTENDDFVALRCSADDVVVLTSRRLIDAGSQKQSAVGLSEKVRPGLVASVHVTADYVFVGLNAGEWGGGLRRIERRSGGVTVIEGNATGDLCGGTLNAACDPVNGIAAEPWKPDCIAVAVGLVHFESQGRIVEVCGDKVQRLYSKPYSKEVSGNLTQDGDDPIQTVAFFGLTREGDSLWAAGIDGIYRIQADGTTRFGPLPSFKNIGDVDVSFDLPHLVVVLTSVYQRRSVSGSAPLLIPREGR